MSKMMRSGSHLDEEAGSERIAPGKRTRSESIRGATPPLPSTAPVAAAATPARTADPFDFSFPPLAASAPTTLPDTVRPELEHSFGMELGSVRVFADSPEAEILGAEAFARGGDIHFAPGRYAGDGGDRHLLAHEVAHVAQQAEGRVAPTVQARGVDLNEAHHLEAEADRMADDAVAGRVARTGPRLQPVTAGVAQGYFTHRGQPLDVGSREVLAVRAALVKAGASDAVLATFDRMARAEKKDHGALALQAPVSVARALRDFGTLPPPTKKARIAVASESDSSDSSESDSASESDSSESDSDSGESSESDSGGSSESDSGDSGDSDGYDSHLSSASDSDGDKRRLGTLGDYDSDEVPDGSDGSGEETLRNKGDKKETKLKRTSLRTAAAESSGYMREMRKKKGRLRADPVKYPPRVAKMGSSYWLVSPNPPRKDVSLAPLKRTDSGQHVERDGKLKFNHQLGPALDKDAKRLGLTWAQLNACVRLLRKNVHSAITDMPHTVDRACLTNLREWAGILILDESRASRAHELIDDEALDDSSSFTARLGAMARYRGAPKGGSEKLQSYTLERKKEEAEEDGDEADDEREDEESESDGGDGEKSS